MQNTLCFRIILIYAVINRLFLLKRVFLQIVVYQKFVAVQNHRQNGFHLYSVVHHHKTTSFSNYNFLRIKFISTYCISSPKFENYRVPQSTHDF
jgi:hypothetical protein